ncbi:MAG: LysR family transcriptional regulator [Clostridia bacterium]|nr:LysR family transcriptional regulator [Clostridia bacterium]
MDVIVINSNQIKIFLSAARYKSFSLAAQKLFISQSSISYQISNLENELKVKLFERDSHTVKLTASGISFYESMLWIDDLIKDAIFKAQTADESERVLTIGFAGENFIRIGAPYISKFSSVYPDTKVALRKYRFKDGCAPLFQKEVNFLFTFENETAGNPLLGFIPLEKCGSYVHLSRDNPLSKKERIEENDLTNQTLLLLELADSQPAYNNLINKWANLNPGLETKQIADMSVIYLEVASNRGITISPFAYSTSLTSNTIALPFSNYSSYCGLAYRKDDNSLSKCNFIDLFKDTKPKESPGAKEVSLSD